MTLIAMIDQKTCQLYPSSSRFGLPQTTIVNLKHSALIEDYLDSISQFIICSYFKISLKDLNLDDQTDFIFYRNRLSLSVFLQIRDLFHRHSHLE